MEDLEVGAAPKVLDGMTELMVYSNYPQAKNIMLFGFDLDGEVDIEAMNSALSDALESFPEFVSGVKEARVKEKQCLVWFRSPDFKPQFRISNLAPTDPSTPLQHSLLRHLSQSVEKDWDLLRTVPTEFHLIRHSSGRSALLTLVHHAAADGWTLSAFCKELLARYHKIVTGQEPPWPREPDLKKQKVELKRSGWRDALFFAVNSLNRYLNKPILPKGSANPQDVGVHYVKSVLTQEESDIVLAHASRFGGPFIDSLVGAVATTVDKWNAASNIPPGESVICVTVQMRGRFGETQAGSNSSSIVVKTLPGERTDPERFAGSVAHRRREQFDNMNDIRTSQAACTLTEAVRVLPLSARLRVAHFVCQMPFIPILIASFGSMWPEISDGRRTGNSYIQRAGGLDLTEFHAIPYKLGYWCPLVFGIHTFRKRLNLQFMASAGHFTRAEAERFVKLLGDVLIENPFGGVRF